MELGLTGRRAVVTGGSKGLGKAIAAELLAEGAAVAICSRHAGELEETAAELRAAAAGRQLLALPGVGEETADAILLYALLHPVPVVDEYLRRIVERHGLAGRDRKYSHVQQLVDTAFAPDPPEFRLQLLNEFHALVVAVGKNHCGPKPRCEGCPLAQFH